MTVDELYEFYLSIPLTTIHLTTCIYPEYVVITGYSFCHPHPHRYFTIEEFKEKLQSSNGEFEKLLKKRMDGDIKDVEHNRAPILSNLFKNWFKNTGKVKKC